MPGLQKAFSDEQGGDEGHSCHAKKARSPLHFHCKKNKEPAEKQAEGGSKKFGIKAA